MADEQTHHLLLYEYVENMSERRGPHREAHLAHIIANRDAGKIVIAGALGDPPTGGAIGFKGVDRDEIEAFVEADPYHEAGLIVGWRIEPWNVSV
jgi:uncharacterized protein YciI